MGNLSASPWWWFGLMERARGLVEGKLARGLSEDDDEFG